jgi:hypothetical protein
LHKLERCAGIWARHPEWKLENPGSDCRNPPPGGEQVLAYHSARIVEMHDPQRNVETPSVNRGRSHEQSGVTAPPQADQPVDKRNSNADRRGTPSRTGDDHGAAGPVQALAWYAPDHYGKGKATQAPRTPQQGKPRPQAECRPRLSTTTSRSPFRSPERVPAVRARHEKTVGAGLLV